MLLAEGGLVRKREQHILATPRCRLTAWQIHLALSKVWTLCQTAYPLHQQQAHLFCGLPVRKALEPAHQSQPGIVQGAMWALDQVAGPADSIRTGQQVKGGHRVGPRALVLPAGVR